MKYSLKIIDRYVLKGFIGTFFMTELVMLFVIIVIDLSEKADKFLASGAPFSEILTKYCLNFALYLGNMYMALVVFIAVIMFTSKMAARTEIIAVISSGVKFDRFLRPYMVGAVFLAILSYLLNSWIVPQANIVRIDFEQKYLNKEDYFDNYIQNVQKQIQSNEMIYIYDWKISTNTGTRFTLERFDDSLKMVYKLWADYIYYNPDSMSYKLNNYYIRKLMPDGTDRLSSGYTLDTTLAITPDEFTPDKKVQEKKTSADLNQMIEKEKVRGAPNIKALMTEKYKRISMPATAFILTILGVSISSRKKRGGTGLNIALGMIMAASYIFMIRIFETLAAQGEGHPLIWLWIPNIIFSVITVFLYLKAKK